MSLSERMSARNWVGARPWAIQGKLGDDDNGSEEEQQLEQQEEYAPMYIDDEDYLDNNIGNEAFDDDGGDFYRPPDFTVVENDHASSSDVDFSGLAGQDARLTQIDESDILGGLGPTISSSSSEEGDSGRSTNRRIPASRRYDARFFGEDDHDEEDYYDIDDEYSYRGEGRRSPREPLRQARQQGESSRFEDRFRPGTRLFVGNIPDGVRWQEIKDHFRVAGEVVFATVIVNRRTKRSRGFGYVQFETPEEAQTAIDVMPDHPIAGAVLEVRQDRGRKESWETPQRFGGGGGGSNDYGNERGRGGRDRREGGRDGRFGRRGGGGGRQWRCGDPDAADESLSEQEQQDVYKIIQRRDFARRRRDYDESDRLREELKFTYNVRLDDRSALWWNEIDYDGGGSSRAREPWRQINTSHDDEIDPQFIFSLLQQRDAARTRHDFVTADRLLDKVVRSPDSPGLTILVHDESRTWRVWEDRGDDGRRRGGGGRGGGGGEGDPAQQAMDLVTRYEPSKIGEVQRLLGNFRGREYQILKKLKQRYLRGDFGNDDD